MAYEKSVIDEANRHLGALTQRIATLENTVQEQAKQLILKDKAHQEQMENLCQKKDSEIVKLNSWLDSTQAEIRTMQIQQKQQDMILAHLKHRCSILENASKYSANLEGLLTCLVEGERLCAVNYEDLVKRQLSEQVSIRYNNDSSHRQQINHNGFDNETFTPDVSLEGCSDHKKSITHTTERQFSITEDSDS